MVKDSLRVVSAAACGSRSGSDTCGLLAMTRHLLPCPECGGVIPVAAGQAGDEVICGGCGAAVTVPRLGDLTRLPRTDGSGGHAESGGSRAGGRHRAGPQGQWTAAHACLWSGLVVAALAGGVAALLASLPKPIINEEGILQAHRTGSIVDVHRVWKEHYQNGVARPPMPDEQAVQQLMQAREGMIRTLWLGASAGGVLATAAGIALLARRLGGSGRRPGTSVG